MKELEIATEEERDEMHVTFFTINMARGGTERVISNLCNEYLIKKYQVTIVTYYSLECCYELNTKIQVRSLGIPYNRSTVSKLLNLREAEKRYLETMFGIKPDIVLAFLPRPCLIACLKKKKLGVPVIGSIRSNPAVNFPNSVYRWCARKILAQADGMVFQTAEARKFFSVRLQKKSVLIMNPVNGGAINRVYKGERTKRIVSVGRFTEEKNYPLLIRAFAKLNLTLQTYSLWIYGKYDERLHIKELAEELGVADRVFFAGEIDHIYDEICDASLFVLPSKSEGMPNALMEAMAIGLPVIATDCPCGGPRLLIKNGENGILVPNDDEKELVQAMEHMLMDYEMASRMGMKAMDIGELYSGQKIYEEWDKYILSVVDKKK